MALVGVQQQYIDYMLGSNLVRLFALTQADALYISERFADEFRQLVESGEDVYKIALDNPDLMACMIATSAHERTAEEKVKTMGEITVIEMFSMVLKVTTEFSESLKFHARLGIKEDTTKLIYGDAPPPVLMAMSSSIKKLQLAVEKTSKNLVAYTRFVSVNPWLANTLEAYLILPITLWPASTKLEVNSLKTLIGRGMYLLPYSMLLGKLGGQITLTYDKVQALARALESVNVGFEPDVLAGAKLPEPGSKVALFALPSGEAHSRMIPAYQIALLTLQLASAVATADGKFSAKEINHLRVQVESWSQLTPNHQRRLMAHLRLLIDEPMSMTALKKKIKPLSQDQKEAIANFMVTVAQSDGTVSPAEVKLLEKLYKTLGVESSKVFRDLHTVAAGFAPSTAKAEKIRQGGFSLDPTRIAELQRDTQRVSALLSTIFTETEDVTAVASGEQDESETAADEMKVNNSILCMDEAHSAFARLLLSRPHWSLDELEDVAANLDLMLDGALEQLNEAAYDNYGIPFTEGDDPFDVNAEILEKLEL